MPHRINTWFSCASARQASQAREKDQEGCAGQCTANRMQAPPAFQQSGRFCSARIQCRIQEAFVGRPDDHKGERDDGREEQCCNDESRVSVLPPGDEGGETAENGEEGLHDRGAAITGSEFSHRELGSAADPCRVLDRVDVDGSPREQAGRDAGDYQRNHRVRNHQRACAAE
jgi:hypothetical protein